MSVLGNIAFQALSMTVLGAFCWMVYTYRGQVVRCLKSTVAFSRATNPRPGAVAVYENFLATALSLGAISTGLAAVKGIVWLAETGAIVSVTTEALPVWVAPVAAGGVAMTAAVVVMMEMGILKAVGKLTFSQKFTDEIVTVKKNWMAAASILTVPLVAMWTGVNPERDIILAYMIAGMIITLFILFATHTLRGFIRQKISLLVWFLYLCAVEIFPVCAVVIAVARNL
ncbi:MAG: DUF4271 domain-containing protein [Alistipes sp.]|nr:DUF4271 domain-containing protein [Alistipes sp.]